MLVTRSTRHDKADIIELLTTQGWENNDVDEGKFWIARDGKVIGLVHLVEVAPQTIVIASVLVREDRRGEGIARRLLEAAMMGLGGTLFLCCHPEHIALYEKFGFKELSADTLLKPVSDYFDGVGDLNPREGHEHHFMTAR